ncbi:MAG: sodium:alanine symporter family protein [Clostridia bacterium]|nr:sodium:alanine symporter family protein [Clostridia bacterium]
MAKPAGIVGTITNYLVDYCLLFVLIGVGLYFSIRTKFVQVRCFGEGMRNVFGNLSLRGGKQKGGLSSFQALATAIAAQVGTGNIVGACAAILVGGPGAIFWMWVIAFLGMATIYAEAVLAQKTRLIDESGEVHGGPVYYIRTAFRGRFGKILAGFFAVATIFALGFAGSMVQSSSITTNIGTAFHIDSGFYWIVGLVIAVLAAVVFIGGVSRLASVTEKMVPIMACLYLLGGLVIVIARIRYIPEAFGMIFRYAFVPNALMGGTFGFALKQAISMGAKRGLFSNEAGMGSTPHAHAQANVKTPHEQGITAMIGVFIDTFIVLTMTALVIISTLYAGDGALGDLLNYDRVAGGLVAPIAKTYPSTELAQMAFSAVFGKTFGPIFVAVCLFFFAFSTILSWNFFGKINFQYLFGKKGTAVYTVLAVIFVFLGSVFENNFVWNLSDLFNNLMVIPNVIGLVALGSMVFASARTKGACDLPQVEGDATAEEE